MRAVGDFQLAHFGTLAADSIKEKRNARDLVTWVDTECEARLAELLAGLKPEAGFLGEEGLRRPGRGDWLWVVDPLDGTTNYAHSLPFFAISVALLNGREPVLGAVCAPKLGETFHGWTGGGAWLGQAPLRVSGTADPGRALFATGFADARQLRADANLRNLGRVLHASRGVRRAGSAALDLAFTAAGRLDGYWEMGLSPWDVAAGIFLVRAAGGRISDMAGGDHAIDGLSIIASNNHLHDWLLNSLEMDPAFAGGGGALG
jgi:myo-inositol-1(or 4)-monophosphatase